MERTASRVAIATAGIFCGNAALALAPNTPFYATLTISGSAILEQAIETQLGSTSSSVCAAGTYNAFRSSSSDFRAYTCTAKPGVVDPTSSGGEAIAVYYRGEGGSITALAPVARAISQYRLNLASCPTPVVPGSIAFVTCPIGSYDSYNDVNVATSGLEAASTQLGVSDMEPRVFIGENYPSANSPYGWLQPALSTAEVTTLSSTGSKVAILEQSFSVYVSNFASGNATVAQRQLADLGDLSLFTLSNLFRGAYADWSQVPAFPGANGSGFAVDPASGALPIKLCRGNPGSGTQASASIYFNNYVQTGQAFASAESPGNFDEVNTGGGGVQSNASTSGLRDCLRDTGHTASGNSTQVGAIGYLPSEPDLQSSGNTPGYKHLLISGQGDSMPSQQNLSRYVAEGRYAYWFDLVTLKRPGIPAAASHMADLLIRLMQSQTSGPIYPNVTFLPIFQVNPAQYPLVIPPAGKKYIGCVTRNGSANTVPIWQCL